MSFTGSQTTTFTAVDIRKVVASFAADFAMMAQSTGLRTLAQVVETVYDLRIFAESGYLEAVTLILKDASGRQIRGAKYSVSTNAFGWVSDRPGNNLWPKTPGGSLKVVGMLGDGWWPKSEAKKQAFIREYGLNSSWNPTTEDTTLEHLAPSQGQRYASKGWGMNRTDFG